MQALANDASIKNARLISSRGQKGRLSSYELIPIKTMGRLTGEKFIFVPDRGYYPINKEHTKKAWEELPFRKSYKGDLAALFISNEYMDYLKYGPIVLNEDMLPPSYEEKTGFQNIEVKSNEKGWFFLDPQYGTGKSTISMAQMISAFKKEKKNFIKSGEQWFKIPQFIKEFDWDLDEENGLLKVNTLGLLRLNAAAGGFDSFAGSKSILKKIQTCIEFKDDIKAPSLKGSKLNLREYQESGLKWLWWLYENNLHGLLADEMGLGKTHQTMALITAIKNSDTKSKFLVMAPTTVLDHWYDKLLDFCPDIKAVKHHGTRRSQNIDNLIKNNDVIITSYGVMLRDIKNLSNIEWHSIILDEAHLIKNNSTATYKAVCKLNSRIRLCLTGTPLENHLGELKNIYDFILPGYLGSDDYFKKNFINPIDKQTDKDKVLELQKLIHPFKMRRTKKEVLKDLPPKVEDIRHCALSSDQTKMYHEVLSLRANPLIEQLEDSETKVSYLHVFATLTMLKQVCNHPELIAKTGNFEQFTSGKFELLKELLAEALGSGHKIVIYSQYVEMIEIISNYLESQLVKHVTLTGKTKNRGKVIKEFQEDNSCKIFVGSLLAGGVGIDLTAASVVIHYDRWWNASKENQATDRVYRIGQNKNVQVLKLVTRGTLEEKIDELIKSKQKLFEKFLDRDEELFKTLSRAQLIGLLKGVEED